MNNRELNLNEHIHTQGGGGGRKTLSTCPQGRCLSYNLPTRCGLHTWWEIPGCVHCPLLLPSSHMPAAEIQWVIALHYTELLKRSLEFGSPLLIPCWHALMEQLFNNARLDQQSLTGFCYLDFTLSQFPENLQSSGKWPSIHCVNHSPNSRSVKRWSQ